ncbi:MAG TPA: hypothetical protein VFF07_13075 [Actinomycetota bacterium]|nr:hypothetical protein [Actinomycetota bacterium]
MQQRAPDVSRSSANFDPPPGVDKGVPYRSPIIVLSSDDQGSAVEVPVDDLTKFRAAHVQLMAEKLWLHRELNAFVHVITS